MLVTVAGLLLALLVVGWLVESAGRAPDDRLAGRATVNEADLPADWTTYRDEGPLDHDVLDDHICGNPAGSLPDHTGGYNRQFGYKLVDGREYAHLDVSVLASPSVESAEAEFAAALGNGSSYVTCVIDRAIQLSKDGSPEETGEPVAFMERLDAGDIPGVIDRIKVVTPTVDGTRVTYVTFVRLQIDRFIVRMPITTWGKAMGDDQLFPLITAVEAKVRGAVAAEAAGAQK